MKRILLAAFVGTASAGALLAQTASDVIIDRAQQPAAPTAPDAANPAKTTDEKGDLDGGTQRIATARKLPFKLTLSYDVQAFYTSNVFLQPNNEVEALVVAQTLQTTAQFNSIAIGEGLLTPTVGLVYQHYNHALGTGDQARQDLDFDAYSIPLALRYRCGDNWEFGLGVTATAVYSIEPSYDLTYKSIGTSLSARKTFVFGRNQFLAAGASINFVKTDADVPPAPFNYRADRNDKVDTTLDVGYYYIKDRWVFSPYARLTQSDYLHYQEAGFNDVNRRDLTFSLGASVSYNLNSWATARAFTSADWRDPQGSSPVDYSYSTQNLGVGLTLSASF
jgi:hypothetical protein